LSADDFGSSDPRSAAAPLAACTDLIVATADRPVASIGRRMIFPHRRRVKLMVGPVAVLALLGGEVSFRPTGYCVAAARRWSWLIENGSRSPPVELSTPVTGRCIARLEHLHRRDDVVARGRRAAAATGVIGV
jgi:hypothetical protein